MKKRPGRIVAPNRHGYHDVLVKVQENLRKVGCEVDVICKKDAMVFEEIKQAPQTNIGKAIEAVRVVMKKIDHALIKGHIYHKAKNGMCNY